MVHEELDTRRRPRDEDAQGCVAEAGGQALADDCVGGALQERGGARLEQAAGLSVGGMKQRGFSFSQTGLQFLTNAGSTG
jgi:hypothetical protein